MNAATPFELVDPARQDPARAAALLAARRIPSTLGNLKLSAERYVPSDELASALNVALALGMPLLLTGEPGTGKTQVAYYVAAYFGIPNVHQLDVRSMTTAQDLLYEFDSVAYFHAAQRPSGTSDGRPQPALLRHPFVKRKALWRAIEDSIAGRASVVLIDEVDKAPRDFPNDILGALDQTEFEVPEWDNPDDLKHGAPYRVRRPADRPPPIVIITSNSERRLPEPFLRRCVFHHIEFDESLLRRAVNSRRDDWPRLDPATVDVAIRRFLDLREKNLRKKPATAELLAWLMVLSAQNAAAPRHNAMSLTTPSLREMPALSVLIKDREDLQELR